MQADCEWVEDSIHTLKGPKASPASSQRRLKSNERSCVISHRVQLFLSMATLCQVGRKLLWRLTYLVVKEDQVLGHELVTQDVLKPIRQVVRLYPEKKIDSG